jgi:hypothetical protein
MEFDNELITRRARGSFQGGYPVCFPEKGVSAGRNSSSLYGVDRFDPVKTFWGKGRGPLGPLRILLEKR